MNTITGSLLSGSTGQISFSVAGLPSGATGSFSQTACNLNCSTIFTVGKAAATSGGTFPITVTATGGGVTKTTAFLLTVLTVTTLTNSSAPAQTWAFCAPENGFCSFSGTMSVAFGANGQFFYQNLTGGTPCNDTVFGDPIPGTVKACYTAPSTTTAGTVTTTSTVSSSQSSTSGTVMTTMASSSTPSTANYYVGKNGSDSNSCSQAQSSSTPKLTINAALACIGTSSGAGANQIVEVAAGTYDEQINNAMPKGSSWSSPFTLRVHSGDTVTIKSTNTNGYSNIYFSGGGAHYSIIDGFIIDGSVVQNSNIYMQGVSFLRFQNLEVENSTCNQFYAYIDVTGVEILNSKIHDGTMFCGGLFAHAIYYSGSNGLFEGNNIYNIQGFGIQIYSAYATLPVPSNNIVRNNVIHNYGLGRYAYGILLGSGDSNIAYNNIVYHGRSKGVASTNGATNSLIYENTVFDMYDPASADGTGIWADGGNAIARNNIAFQIVTGANIVCGTYGPATCDHNLTSDPLFVNSSSNDFHLRTTSPAIDAGVTLSQVPYDFDGISRPQGSAYDIGAYEYH